MLDVLVIAAHPDDAELGMGATIAKLGSEGFKVGILNLTDGEPTPCGSPSRRRVEAEKAAEILGVCFLEILEFPNRFLMDSVEVRKKVAAVIRKTAPKLVFIPYFEDAHPDHVAASQIALAARFYSKLTKTDIPGEPVEMPDFVYYFAFHLRKPHSVSFVVDVSDFFDKKLSALRAYKSQFVDNEKNRFVFELARISAEYWGTLAGVRYAEPFYSPQVPVLKDVTCLLK